MTGNRVFTTDELKEMEGRTLDLPLTATDKGNREKAGQLARRMHKEFLSIHDDYARVATSFKSQIYRRFGMDVLEEV